MFTKNDLETAFQILNERERAVIVLRFGLDNCGRHTLGEVGEELNLSHERVRQIERVALKKLKAPLRALNTVPFQDVTLQPCL